MKLLQAIREQDYRFTLFFANGEIKTADLKPLIGSYVSPEALPSAHVDPDWGCLEFNQGLVDIEPRTLYRFVQ